MLEPGTQVGDRYRLDQEVDSAEESSLWRATDEVLARTVSLRLFGAGFERQDAVLAAACAASRLNDPRLAHVFDVGRSGGCAYVVTEWPRGMSLAEILAAGPLPPHQAVWLIGEAARALSVAHATGLAHQLLSPRSLYRTPTGRVKLFGTGTEAAAAGRSGGDPMQRDLRGLGLLLWSALIGREPRPGERVVLPVAGTHGRELEACVERVVGEEPAAYDLQRFAELLEVIRSGLTRPPPPARIPQGSGRPRRAGLIALTSGALTVSVTSSSFAFLRAEAPERHLIRAEITAPAPVTKPSRPNREPSRLHPRMARTFDPYGDGGGGATLGDDAQVTFHTQRYTTSAFGNLKPGTGVLLDMGGPVSLSSVHLRLGRWHGAELHLRLGDRPSLRALDTVTTTHPSDPKITLHPTPDLLRAVQSSRPESLPGERTAHR